MPIILANIFPLILSVFLILKDTNGEPGTAIFPDNTPLTGESYASESYPGTVGYVYYGIRYGISKRFEASVENTEYSYLRNSSRLKQGHACPQGFLPGFPLIDDTIVDEDCLYLDIYTPPTLRNVQETFPVLVWFHGGALQVGSKDRYNGSYGTTLADGIRAVIVTVNYRLSAFGTTAFLSTGDDAAKCNFGLGDSITALTWIRKNIGRFAGRPDALTLVGQSDGAAFISVMLLDPILRDMIQNVVMLSGSMLMDWAYIRDPLNNAQRLGGATGCPIDTTTNLVNCLKALPFQRLAHAARAVQPPSPLLSYIASTWALVTDNEHIHGTPLQALSAALNASASRIPHIVTSYLREDMSIILSASNPDLFNPDKPLTVNDIRQVVATEFLPRGGRPLCAVPNYALADTVMQHYNITETDAREDKLWKLFHLASEATQGYPAAKEALLYSAAKLAGNSVQLLRIIYDSHYQGLGAFHMMELPYLFGPALLLPNQTYDPRLKTSLQSVLRQVAYTGKLEGTAFSPDTRYGYMELGQSAEWRTGDYDILSMAEFWDKVAQTPCPSGNYGAY